MDLETVELSEGLEQKLLGLAKLLNSRYSHLLLLNNEQIYMLNSLVIELNDIVEQYNASF